MYRSVKHGLGIILAFSSLYSYADTLSLYLIRSPFGINWSSPQALAFSTLANQLGGTHTIGHAFAGVRCDGDDGMAPYSSITGMTSEGDTEEKELLLKEKVGFGIFWHNFKGRLQHSDEAVKSLALLEKQKRVRTVNFSISPKTCRRLQRYSKEYEMHKIWGAYGLSLDPLLREGAGCTAYAVSFLRVAGIPTDELRKEWSRTVNIPMRYIGGSLNPKKRVDILKLALNPMAGKWATENQPHKVIFFWDPDLMYGWAKRASKRSNKGMKTDQLEISSPSKRQIEIDARGVKTPEGSIWIQ